MSVELDGGNLQDIRGVGSRLEQLKRIQLEQRDQADTTNKQETEFTNQSINFVLNTKGRP